jgi:hypothetical protein
MARVHMCEPAQTAQLNRRYLRSMDDLNKPQWQQLGRELADAMMEYDEAAMTVRSLIDRGAIRPGGLLTPAEVAEKRARDQLIAARRRIFQQDSDLESLPIG